MYCEISFSPFCMRASPPAISQQFNVVLSKSCEFLPARAPRGHFGGFAMRNSHWSGQHQVDTERIGVRCRLMCPASRFAARHGSFGTLPGMAASARCPTWQLRFAARHGSFGTLPGMAASVRCPAWQLRHAARHGSFGTLPDMAVFSFTP